MDSNPTPALSSRQQTSQGLLFGFMAYGMWGVFPLFFHQLRMIPASEVLMHRIIWSFVFVLGILLVMGWSQRLLQALANPILRRGLIFSSLLVSFNWLVFIWAVSNGRVLESSLGYFLTPLVSVFLAHVFLKEAISRAQLVAILLAACGVIWLLIRLGYLPWVSLALAISFGLYGLMRKQLNVDSLTGLTLETAVLLPLALLFWIHLGLQGQSHFYVNGWRDSLLLMASGMVTALPLLLFASATKRLSLTVVGFMMYINPSLQFLLALFVLNEPFNVDQLIGFCFIWLALIIFTIGSISLHKHQRQEL